MTKDELILLMAAAIYGGALPSPLDDDTSRRVPAAARIAAIVEAKLLHRVYFLGEPGVQRIAIMNYEPPASRE